MDTTAETKEPTPKAGGRKRKSTTPVAAVASKRRLEFNSRFRFVSQHQYVFLSLLAV